MPLLPVLPYRKNSVSFVSSVVNKLLMLLTQQVIHCLHRVKGRKRNFYKDGIPVAHRTIPQAGKFEGFQVFTVLRFVGDEAGGFIYIFHQVEFMSFIITHSAYEVYRIEVCAFLEHFFLLRIVHVDL